jgi:hypothetical protein
MQEYQNVVIPYLYEVQHVLGETTPIIRSLKLHWQPLVSHSGRLSATTTLLNFSL